MATILGIDEAGRGPVIGPLVMAGALVHEESVQALQEMGVKDSKLLSAKQRVQLYPKILALVKDWKVVVLQPSEIDDAVKSYSDNLNWLEARTSAQIVNALAPNAVIIDCPSPNISAYEDFLRSILDDKKLELALEHKAERHMPVAAASIIAKVTRDRIIDELKKEISVDFGSGYLTDEKTQAFLKNHDKKYEYLFRKSWEPYAQQLNAKMQKKLGEF